jgi:E3 ubiquitin-protein ligase BAH
MKFAKEYQRYMTDMEEELPALGLKRLKEMIKKCQAMPCSPQGLSDEKAVVVGGGSQCSGASHCYGMYSC